MRFNINLATQPYEAARQFKRQMGAAIIIAAVTAVALLGYIVQQWYGSRDVNRQIAAAQQEISSLESEKAQAQAILNRPANRVVANQSHFLNELFARKALSWTRVFSEMEKIMPYNLAVISMKPEYTKDNQLLLHVVVATSSRDKAVELVEKMEQSKHFLHPQVVAEQVLNTSEQSGGAGNIQFDIAAIYLPDAQDQGDSADEEKNAEENQQDQKQEKPTPKKNQPARSTQNTAQNVSPKGGAR